MPHVTPSPVTMISSPGSTSRSYFARSRSKAHVSEAKTTVSGPSGLWMRPIDSGRKPWGSRAAKMRSRVIITIEKAPSTCRNESAIASTSVVACECAMSCTMISESLVVWKNAPCALELHAEVAEVHEVPVVRDGDQALGRFHADGLRVQQRRVACRRVARVPDGHVALEARDHVVGENFRNQPHALDIREMGPVGCSDAGGFLPTMLQRIEPEIDLPRRIRMPVNRHDAAVFAELGVGIVCRCSGQVRICIRARLIVRMVPFATRALAAWEALDHQGLTPSPLRQAGIQVHQTNLPRAA